MPVFNVLNKIYINFMTTLALRKGDGLAEKRDTPARLKREAKISPPVVTPLLML